MVRSRLIRFLPFAALLLFPLGCYTQTFTSGSGTKIQDGTGNLLTQGTICFSPYNSSGTLTAITPAGGSPSTGPFCYTVHLGAWTTFGAPTPLPNLLTASPSGLNWKIQVLSQTAVLILDVDWNTSFSGATATTDILVVGASLGPNATSSGLGSPYLACAPPASYFSTNNTTSRANWTCAVTNGSPQWFQSGVSPAPGPGQQATVPVVAQMISDAIHNIPSLTGAQIVALFPGTDPCFLRSDVTCDPAGGGGGSIPGTIHQAIFSDGAGNGSASVATIDTPGNYKMLSVNGLRDAYMSQSTPTSGNGIANALAVPNTSVVAGPDYISSEGSFSGNSTCLPGDTNWRDAIGCPPPGFGNNTFLWDLRGAEPTSYAYNTDPSGGGAFIDRWVSNQQTQRSGGGYFVAPYLRDFELMGSGKDGFRWDGGPDSFEAFQWSFENTKKGIVDIMNLEEQNYSSGDNHLYEFVINNVRWTRMGSDEGFNIWRTQLVQNTTPMVMTANTTQAAGATLIPGSLISNVPFVGDGLYLMNFTKAGPIRHIVSYTNPGGPTAGTMTLDGPAFTPDNFGRIAAQVNTPTQYYGATTPMTFTVSGLSAALNTASTVCVADPEDQESAVVTAVGSPSGSAPNISQSITANLRLSHQANAYIAQGVNTCWVIEMRALQTPGSFPGRHLYRQIGATSSSTIVYARTSAGNFQAPSSYVSTLIVAPPSTTITRNGSNVASVTVSDPSKLFNQVFIIVSGCANTTFNGFYATTIDTGTTLSWPNTGSATTTTCTNAIEIQSKLNGISVREAQSFPAAEIVNPLDPVTHANNFNITVEHNSNFRTDAGDQLENHVGTDTIMGQDHTVYTFKIQTSPSTPSIIHAESFGGEVPEGTTEWRIAYQDPASNYIGLGGTKPIFNTLLDMGFNTTPFATLFNGMPPPKVDFFNINGCLYGCLDTRSQFNFLSMAMANGFLREEIHQGEQFTKTIMSDVVTNAQFIRFEGPAFGQSIQEGNGVAGTGSLSTRVDTAPGQVQTTVTNGFGAIAHQTLTPAGLALDVPLTVTSCTGCGSAGIANIVITLPTSSIPANTCTTPATATMTGLITSSVPFSSFASDPAAATGWGANGGLVFTSWPTANTLNWEVCNQTAGAIVPGAINLNVGAR